MIPIVFIFLQVTALPRPGEKRAAQSFDIRFSTLAEATVDILFSKCKVSENTSIIL